MTHIPSPVDWPPIARSQLPAVAGCKRCYDHTKEPDVLGMPRFGPCDRCFARQLQFITGLMSAAYEQGRLNADKEKR